MNESKLYEAIEAALSGAQHIEEVAGMIISDAREAGHDGDWDQYRTQIDSYGCTIASTIDAIETILFHLLEIHKEEGKTAARLDEIEEAAKAIAIIERPELMDPKEAHPLTWERSRPEKTKNPNKYITIPEDIEEEIPFK